jgi:hypothetical protein
MALPPILLNAIGFRNQQRFLKSRYNSEHLRAMTPVTQWRSHTTWVPRSSVLRWWCDLAELAIEVVNSIMEGRIIALQSKPEVEPRGEGRALFVDELCDRSRLTAMPGDGEEGESDSAVDEFLGAAVRAEPVDGPAGRGFEAADDIVDLQCGTFFFEEQSAEGLCPGAQIFENHLVDAFRSCPPRQIVEVSFAASGLGDRAEPITIDPPSMFPSVAWDASHA